MEQLEFSFDLEGAKIGGRLISPLVGEMGGSPEGGVPSATLPASALPGISPTRGEIGCGYAVTIVAEADADFPARDALLNAAMGPRWRKKSSEKLRRGRMPAAGLAFVAKDAESRIAGTVRLWDVALGEGGQTALLLGPLAVGPAAKSGGIGSALMRHAIAEATRLGHGAILLVGDASYYARFGFSAEKTGNLAMPGPYERRRFLALELEDGALDCARGVLKAAGRKAPVARTSLAA